MANPLLSNFELAGQQIDIRDSASYELATAAQQAAETAGATATAAQQAAETAGATATAAQQAADNIVNGFSTQFTQISSTGNVIAPYYCKRNNTVYVEFPNLPFLKSVSAEVWTSVFKFPDGYRPISTCYRAVNVGGASQSMLVEIASSGQVKVFPIQAYGTSYVIFGGFSFITI